MTVYTVDINFARRPKFENVYKTENNITKIPKKSNPQKIAHSKKFKHFKRMLHFSLTIIPKVILRLKLQLKILFIHFIPKSCLE